MEKNNIILMTDSYKLSHWKQYPKGTRRVYSYLESRGGEYGKTVFFGLQYYLKKYLQGTLVTQEDVEEATEFGKSHFGTDIFNREGWEWIVNEHGGRLPIEIKAVPEGTIVPVSNVMMTIDNTDPKCYWLTNVMETLLMKIWYPITVASNSYHIKQLIKSRLQSTGSSLDGLPFKLHDFGYRGVSSEETARIGGAAHLTSFMGTDTLGGIILARDYYQEKMAGFSVPASEHSVACSFGPDHEEDYFINMLKTYPSGIVSIVSDTYNIFEFVRKMSSKFKDMILSRNGTVVFRPDSGDPVEVNSKLIDTLWEIFGGSYTDTHHKLLVPQVRLIQGDGIDAAMIEQILNMAEQKGFAADNWVFGSGGGLLQKFDRDTQKFAIKASYGEKVDERGETYGFAISKDPITSKGKRSKPGKLKLHRSNNTFMTYSSFEHTEPQFNSYIDEMRTVYKNGEIMKDTLEDFQTIRDRIESFSK